MIKEKLSLYQTLGSNLISKGKWFLNKATFVNKWYYSSKIISKYILEVTGITPALYDERYYTTDIETWKTIIKNDWTNKKKWIADTFDCDNFAGSFTAYCADIYGLNSAGRFTVELLDPETNAHIGYHRAVIIIDKKLDCYLLESQSDEMVKIEKGIMPMIDNWKYKCNYISLN